MARLRSWRCAAQLVVCTLWWASSAQGLTPTAGLVLNGTADNRPMLCRPVTITTLSRQGGVLTLDADCGGAARLHCQPTTFAHTATTVTADCKTITASVPFKVAHLPAMTTIYPGSTAPLLVQVYNNTGKTLTSVQITASAAPACSTTRSNVAAGGVVSYSCSSPAATSDLVDTISVTGTATDNTVFHGTAQAIVMVDGPRLSLAVAPSYQVVAPGARAAWSVAVRNAGSGDLTSLLVADQRVDSTCAGSLSTLSSGGLVRIDCAVPSVATSFTDRFSASAYGPGALVSDVFASVVTRGDAIFHGDFETVTTAASDTLFKGGFE